MTAESFMAGISIYPCDRGIPHSMARSFHEFTTGPNGGQVFCMYCGREPYWADEDPIAEAAERIRDALVCGCISDPGNETHVECWTAENAARLVEGNPPLGVDEYLTKRK